MSDSPIRSAGKAIGQTVVMIAITLVVTAVAGEALLRLKNANQDNYVIEMWRYARELKVISDDPALGHVHVPGAEATLQNTHFRINALGMRGPNPALGADNRKTVLFLGSSITLGWGVVETEVVSTQLAKNLGNGFNVLNGGVGNYNAQRSVANFAATWRGKVSPDVVVMHYFVNDAEALPPSRDNFVMRNSQLAVSLYHIAGGLLTGAADTSALVKHYRKVYHKTSAGREIMESALDRLDEMAKRDNFKVVLAMIPDIHQLNSYPFEFVHRYMRGQAEKRGWAYVDFLVALAGYRGPELWTIPGDPHPNGKMHGIMAERLAPVVRLLASSLGG